MSIKKLFFILKNCTQIKAQLDLNFFFELVELLIYQKVMKEQLRKNNVKQLSENILILYLNDKLICSGFEI
jgi:hypothetical protein